MSAQLDRVTIPADGSESVELGGLGIVWKIEGAEADGRFSVVHHPLAPRALAAPLHRHTQEDEYSYVLEGTLGALLGEEVITAGPGTWVRSSRPQASRTSSVSSPTSMQPKAAPISPASQTSAPATR